MMPVEPIHGWHGPAEIHDVRAASRPATRSALSGASQAHILGRHCRKCFPVPRVRRLGSGHAGMVATALANWTIMPTDRPWKTRSSRR
jgi:hypothetical protein